MAVVLIVDNAAMDAAELRARARQEADELGPIPLDPREREMWH
jgi:hypothetical protein